MVRRLPALKLGLAVAGVLLPTAARPAEPPQFAPDFYRAHVQEYAYGRAERVILFRRLKRDANESPRWLVERRERVTGHGRARPPSYEWIDSRDCDAVTLVLRRLDALPSLAVRGPTSLGSFFNPIFHAPVVTLEASPMNMGGSEIQLTVTDAKAGPVYKWWSGSQEALEHCWRRSGAVIDGKPVEPGIPEIAPWRG
ncbi:MAG TPA: hypothetical protein VIP08_09020 [Phenylobacterium sp.]|uniref:hypothetical protein n=1 Tax=Phenylobacterium sp. TaxID=1871053 RepID=UPI002F94F8B9